LTTLGIELCYDFYFRDCIIVYESVITQCVERRETNMSTPLMYLRQHASL